MEKKVGYCYPSGLEKTLCKWDIHVPLVTKGLNWQAHPRVRGFSAVGVSLMEPVPEIKPHRVKS